MGAAIHFCSVRLTRRLIWLVALFVLGLTVAAPAQVLPRHVDPNLRQSTKNAPNLPALRFLTVADYPPFNYRDDTGALVGFNIDLAKAICDDLSIVCTMQAWPWAQAADALADNQGDALIGGLALDDETATRFTFSSVYLRFPARFVVPKAALASSFSPDRLNGHTVAVRKGSRHEAFLTAYLPGAERVAADSEFAALDLVKSGEAEAYFGDGLRAAFWLGQNSDCCGFAGEAYFRPDYFGQGLAIAVAPDREEVESAIDFALNRLVRSGKMDELYLQWFPIGFY